MTTFEWIVVIAAALVVAVIVVALVQRALTERRRNELRETFGPEYDRAIDAAGSQRKAERDLADREQRRRELDIKPLSEAARSRYLEEWHGVQNRFVDDPESAVVSAERLVRRVLDERGYPEDDDEDTRAATVSVDHPDVTQHYRHGHEILRATTKSATDRTENLRKAMVDFRAVLEALLEGEREPVTV